ncbi:MAG: sulfatase [Opitutales bacterium]
MKPNLNPMMRMMIPYFLLTTLFAGCALAAPLNIVLITADDMNWDSTGVTGSMVPDITPNIDRLASEGILMTQAHATIPVCQPVRASMHTGLYPNRSGARGFGPIQDDVRTINEVMHDSGYLISMLAKVPHYEPIEKWCLDYMVSAKALDVGRSPEKFGRHTRHFLDMAADLERPFFHHVNGQDPHRPFNWGGEDSGHEGIFPGVNREISPDEVTVPGFLEKLPEVRQEVADYYTCVHRFDELVGRVLAEIDAAGLRDNTLVMLYMGDHGMAFPFAKSNLYAAGTRGTLIMRWPGEIPPGEVDHEHMVSTIDFAPTLLEAAGLPPLEGIDGRSFLAIAKGGSQSGRDRVMTVYHEVYGGKLYEMRAIRTHGDAYIWNAWSDGEKQYRAENMSGATWAAMVEAGKEDPGIRDRCQYYLYRSPEEFFLVDEDPFERNNRIDDPEYAEPVAEMRGQLLDWMEQINDPLLEEFRALIAP